MTLSSDPTLKSLLRQTHVAQSRAELMVGGAVFADLLVVGGSVSVDARRGVRRSLTLETLDPDGSLTQGGLSAPLSPLGDTEIKVYRGVVDPSVGTVTINTEVLLGIFRVTSVDQTVGADGSVAISVTGDDRAYYVSRLVFTECLEIAAGTKISDPSTSAPGVMQQVLNRVKANSLPRNLPTIASSVGTYKWIGSDPQEDPWVALTDLATCIGYELYVSADGTITATVPPSITGTIDWEYLQDESNVVLSVSRSLSAEGVYNGVQMQSQSSTYAYGEAYNRDSLSPTSTVYLGERPFKIESPYVRTANQAAAAAGRLLPLYAGQPMSWTQVPNPAMDVRDRVRLVEARLGIDATVIVDALTIPLDPGGTMSVEGRAL